MKPGRVIVLNGASSSGKTSLGRALQDRLPGEWLLLGIDTFITTLPWKLSGTVDGHTINDGNGSIDIGSRWRELQACWRAAVSALSHAGADVVLDEVMLRAHDEQAEWRAVLDGLDVTWIGVRCDLDVLERRERVRGDRGRHTARWQHERVHAGVEYDLEVDTSRLSPAAAADLVAEHLGTR